MITVVSNLGGNSSGLESVTVQCPNNTLRVACNGSRHPDLIDASHEKLSGLIGVRPVAPNGCQSAMDGGGNNRIVVYAICLDPNGTGNAPTATTPTGSGDGVGAKCGPAHGTIRSNAPANRHLCDAGSSSALSGSGPWTWTCTSQEDNNNVRNCRADQQFVGADCPAETVVCDAGNRTVNVPAFKHGQARTFHAPGTNNNYCFVQCWNGNLRSTPSGN